MKYFLDTEFIEKKNSITLISIGIKCEDGRKLHLISSEYEFKQASEWVVDNVIRPLYIDEVPGDLRNRLSIENFHQHIGESNNSIAKKIIKFTEGTKPEFWAYYADYDWVVFCWLFGTMMELPEGYPMYCKDLKQLLDESEKDKIPDPEGAHNALVDAEWNEKLYHHLTA